MDTNINKKNRIMIGSVIVMMFFVMILTLSIPVDAATDLPIDIDEVYQIEGMGTRAVTVSRGVDLFTKRSRGITDAMITQQERRREQALGGLFDPLYQMEELTGEERLIDHVVSSGLFRNGVSFREGGETEVVDGEPILLIVILMITCGVIGFIIAKLSLRGGKKNVY